MSEFALSLAELFAVAHRQFTDIMEKGTMEADSTALVDIENALNAVQREGIFSKNEELDDIPTSSIKYLFLRHFLGMVHSKSMSNRLEQLNSAKLHLMTFLETCATLKVLHEDELKAMNPTQQVGR